MRFEGKCAVVTGASSGMGRAIALRFAQEGATVVAVARRKERLDEIAAQAEGMPGSIVPFAGDVTDPTTVDGMMSCAIERCGTVDVLVNNAGVMDEFKPVGEVSDELWQRVMKLNLDAPMMAMRAAVRIMKEKGTKGSIVNVASIGGVRGCRAGAAYTASKHALVGLTKNTAFMYQPDGIRCNAVCPGGVNTEVMNGQTDMSQAGLGRVMAGLDSSIASGKPEDIAAGVLFLASEEARFMTGSVVVMDGGVSCN